MLRLFLETVHISCLVSVAHPRCSCFSPQQKEEGAVNPADIPRGPGGLTGGQSGRDCAECEISLSLGLRSPWGQRINDKTERRRTSEEEQFQMKPNSRGRTGHRTENQMRR